MTEIFRSNCLVCGQPLVYFNEYQQLTCNLCGKIHDSQVACQSGHFVCDSCHESSANDLIEQVCIQSNSTRPLELAIDLMKSPVVKMHGPEHHFLVPAVLLSACYNKLEKPEQKEKKIRIARKRAENVLSGFCGFYGACGAGIGTGIFIALYTDSDPMAREQWGLANLMTAESLRCIGALGGPRCCKRDTFIALKTAVKFLQQIFSVHLEMPKTITCEFSDMNFQCIEEDCPYYQKVPLH
jgi:hypothetical protein